MRTPDLGAGKVEVAPVDQEVLFHGQFGVEVVLLGDDAEAGPDRRAMDFGIEVEDPQMTRSHRGHRGDHPHRRGLAGAIGPEKAERLALCYIEADAVDGHHLPEMFREVFGLDQVRCSQPRNGSGRKTETPDARRQGQAVGSRKSEDGRR